MRGQIQAREPTSATFYLVVVACLGTEWVGDMDSSVLGRAAAIMGLTESARPT
jgi:hypothetical protein